MEDCDPTIENNYRKQVIIDGGKCVLNVLNIAEQEEFAFMHDSSMRTTQGFIVVYAIDNRNSFAEPFEILQRCLRVKNVILYQWCWLETSAISKKIDRLQWKKDRNSPTHLDVPSLNPVPRLDYTWRIYSFNW